MSDERWVRVEDVVEALKRSTQATFISHDGDEYVSLDFDYFFELIRDNTASSPKVRMALLRERIAKLEIDLED